MRISRIACLATVLAAGVALAADDCIAKGKKFTVVMTRNDQVSGTKSTQEFRTEYTITAVTDAEISYDLHETCRGTTDGVVEELPDKDLSDQRFPRGGESSQYADDTDVEVDAGIWRGTVKTHHRKIPGDESWLSEKPFEATLQLEGGPVKVHCGYAKSEGVSSGMKTMCEIVSLAEFPVVHVFKCTRTAGDGVSSESITRLQSIR